MSFFAKLNSRKLWMSVGAAAAALAAGQPVLAVVAAVAYVLAQGHVDAVVAANPTAPPETP